MRIIGHRGGGSGPEENTLASALRGISEGADEIELDVQLIDGELRLGHSSRSDTLLSTVLPKLRVPVVLHLKRRFSRRRDREMLKLVSKLRHGPGILVSSFWPGTLRHAKRHYPELRTAFITWWVGWDRHFAKSLGVSELHAWDLTLTRRAARKARETGMPLIAFILGPSKEVLKVPVDGVIADTVRLFVDERTRNPD